MLEKTTRRAIKKSGMGFELLLSELPTVTLTEETSGLYRRLLICFFYKLTLEALPISVF